MGRGRPPKSTARLNKVDTENAPIYCIRCGCSNKNNFYKTKDINRKFYGRIPYCKTCLKEMYQTYEKRYKSANLAFYYFCRKIDVAYIHANYEGALNNIKNPNASIKDDNDSAIISAYMKGLSFAEQNGWGLTFDESQGEDQVDGIISYDEITKVKRNIKFSNSNTEDYDVLEFDTQELVQKWGLFDNEDLAYLESEYMDWEDKLNGITEKSTDIMVKQVCLQCNEIRKDRESGISVEKKLKTLQDLLKTSGLIEMQTNVSEDKIVGMTISDIEYKRPIKAVDPDFADIDNIRDIIYGFTGAMCRTLGKENYYTSKFDEIYGKYGIDIIDDLKAAKERESTPDIPIGDGGVEND